MEANATPEELTVGIKGHRAFVSDSFALVIKGGVDTQEVLDAIKDAVTVDVTGDDS